MTRKYQRIVAHYEACLERHGDTPAGVDWPRAEDVDTRHRIMLEMIRPGATVVDLLDFGCGASHLYDYILRSKRSDIRYSGLDISPRFVALSRSKYPDNTYYLLDILGDDEGLGTFDYIVMNGVFTEKRDLTFEEMLDYFQAVLRAVFPKARVAIAFNAMSKQVDWERDDLFHLPFDVLASFLTREISRHFTIRQDYGLYEYTTYVYRRPTMDAYGETVVR